MTSWWYRKPWWSAQINGKLLLEIVSFFIAMAVLYLATETEFRLIVSVYLAAKAAPAIASAFRDTPPP